MQPSNKRQLELMGTPGCHLCDDAELMLAQYIDFNTTDIILVDIAESDVLLARYSTSIPVLHCINSGKELNWPFDATGLIQFLVGLN